MPVTIKVNGTVNSLVHKMSNGISIATIPDVCKTPSPGGPVPIPYPNIAQSITLSNGTTTVKGDKMIAANKGSKFALSNGDQAGTVGGVKSNVFMKEATWILYSFDVKLQGKGACRLTDKMFHNKENTVNLAGVFQGPVHVTAAIGQEIADEICTSICEARKRANKPKGSKYKLPNKKHRTLQSYVASRHSSGFPRFEPNRCDLLVETTWRMPSKIGGAFSSILSKARKMSNGRLAPTNFFRGLSAGRGAPGTTFRPDFTVMNNASRAARWNNAKAFVDVKFEGDTLTDNQQKAKKLAGKSKFKVIEEKDCACS